MNFIKNRHNYVNLRILFNDSALCYNIAIYREKEGAERCIFMSPIQDAKNYYTIEHFNNLPEDFHTDP